MSLILGLDPGSLRVGYGLIEASGGRLSYRAHGVLIAPAQVELPQRLLRLHGQLDELLSRLLPDAVAIEKVFAARNAHSALVLGQARGVVVLAAVQHGLSLAEYTPAEVKLAVAGNGRASKSQLATLVNRLLAAKLPDQGMDASDALAIAICHSHSQARERLVARARAGTRA